MIRRTEMFILYLPQQMNTCSKSAIKTFEITEDNSNENIFKKQPPDVFYKKSVLKNSKNSLRSATLLKRGSGKDVYL